MLLLKELSSLIKRRSLWPMVWLLGMENSSMFINHD
jgi:hypothetical protein